MAKTPKGPKSPKSPKSPKCRTAPLAVVSAFARKCFEAHARHAANGSGC